MIKERVEGRVSVYETEVEFEFEPGKGDWDGKVDGERGEGGYVREGS